MASFEAVLFDFDGVLVDSEAIHFACWCELLQPLGASLDWESYNRYCVGVADRALLEFFASRCCPPVDVERIREQYPLKKQRFRERAAQAKALVPPGVSELLASLAGGYKLAVVTSSGRSEVEPVLEATAIRQYFGALVSGDDVTRHKPAPDPYLLAASRLNVKVPLVVEDSPAGLESARAAGFEAVHITDPSRTAELVRARLEIAA